MLKNLPIGIQTLSEIRARNAIYVDKTQHIHQLVTTGKYYFYSRPRRFGKSLLISVLKNLYLANKELFIDTWIYDKWNWSRKNPVIHISFDAVDYEGLGLKEAIMKILLRHAKQYQINLSEQPLKSQFEELLINLYEQYGKVVLLIDEYDKPIIDYLEDSKIDIAKANRAVLREFYSVLKNADSMIELVFITGISKFSKVSLFSLVNNLDDITLTKKFATMTGYTQNELEHYFADYLNLIAEDMNISKQKLLNQMKIWYNGYSWDGVQQVYNPFGVLNFLSKGEFKNFWFATGSPRFLIQQMEKQTFFNVENITVNSIIFEKYDIENIELVPLLFQTGYLTVKEKDIMTGDLVLDYPNKEVRESLYQFLIDDIAKNPHRIHTGRTVRDMYNAFAINDIAKVVRILNAILADLPYNSFSKQTEGLYHGLIHIIFNYLGMFVQSEVHSSDGRADAVIETTTHVYIFEFKFNRTAQEAINQILNQNYAAKYQTSNKSIIGIGINFNEVDKNIDSWLQMNLNN